MQNRRAELLNRRIRHRHREAAGARPDQHDDAPSRPLLARYAKINTVEGVLEAGAATIVAIAAPIGWPAGKLLYHRIEALIPDRLRSYPIPALLWSAAAIGTITTAAYILGDHSTTVTATLIAPWIMAQLPATLLTAGCYGILNGWLAIDGSTDWWPLTPPPPAVDLDVSMLQADDLTFRSIFATADPPAPFPDLPPVAHTPGQPVRLVVAGLLVCTLGTLWTTTTVAIDLKEFLLSPGPQPTLGI
ncbi:hypothetical protein KIH27_20265 [Mycobacterium sp. M1]|uniref:Uncharacterized protein n=1 Tax=Mycolicibacter acidiphilus TaxID=2835306 RepID=A0ABS5RNM9_9MYCO|nr:hypothetical protein [Mycolicibacter acidiphilus]MBS9535921.1 hypothetical protein [Mycolicibacter acidiphilus]